MRARHPEPLNRLPAELRILYHAHPWRCVGIEETECAAFLAATAFPKDVKVRPVVECGAIENMLTRYVRA